MQVWAGLAMVFAQVWDRFEQVYEAECCKSYKFYRLCRRDVCLHVGVGRVWGRFGYIYIYIYITLVLHTGVSQVWGGLTQSDAESVHSFVMLRQVDNRVGQV